MGTTGLGPVYLAPSGGPDPMLTSTSSSGRTGWMNITVGGMVEFTLVPPAGWTCHRNPLAWAGSTPFSLRAPLVADTLISTFNFTCD